ncbi:Inositol monophosphatase family protein [Reichenbachiella agariperforans]|uniref:Inositol monophosphatase family protein n=1 Tax=Reichenbachiella agariperforans TaxID=156994 RepID=A0A1M6J391_REIAG|nr:inositol monophosphatase family protein [Reichenbachiella agariperforans]SHJ41205.1 Inositol monophosphatase family protein [Reichenbachiella agariperforans]
MKAADLKTLAQLAEQAAAIAADFIRQYSHGDITVELKSGMSSKASEVVTWVDLQCQTLILNHLQESIAHYDLGLLTEELPDDGSRLTKDYFWCIDPLDGTLAFTERRPGYAVSIALVSRTGVPMIGVVHEPITDQRIVAVRGQGVQSSLERTLDNQATPDQLICCLDHVMAEHPRYAALRTMLDELTHSQALTSTRYISGAGAVLQACQASLHEHAVFFKIPKVTQGGGCIWDYAATACIFEELGYHVTDLYGAPLQLNNPKSLYMNHCGVLYSSRKELAQDIIDWFQSIER